MSKMSVLLFFVGSNSLIMYLDPAEASYFSFTHHNISENQTSKLNATFSGKPTPSVMVINNDTGVVLMSYFPLAGFSINFFGHCDEDGTYILMGYNKHNTQNFSMSDHLSVLCKLAAL